MYELFKSSCVPAGTNGAVGRRGRRAGILFFSSIGLPGGEDMLLDCVRGGLQDRLLGTSPTSPWSPGWPRRGKPSSSSRPGGPVRRAAVSRTSAANTAIPTSCPSTTSTRTCPGRCTCAPFPSSSGRWAVPWASRPPAATMTSMSWPWPWGPTCSKSGAPWTGPPRPTTTCCAWNPGNAARIERFRLPGELGQWALPPRANARRRPLFPQSVRPPPSAGASPSPGTLDGNARNRIPTST